jgi:hypothetical protein
MDYRSARESEDSTLPSKSPLETTGAPPPSKITRKPRASSSSASPKPSSSATFYSSMDDPGVASWIASLRAGRASPIPWPENAREPATSAGSGTISPESSASAKRPSFSERTSPDFCATPIAQLSPSRTWMTPQLTLLGEWEPFSGIWPRWGMSRSGEVFELPTWAPRTEEPECSYWPTAKAQSHEGLRGNDLRHGRILDEEAAKWAMAGEQWRTPAAGPPLKGGSQPPNTPNGGRKLDRATTLRHGTDADGIKRTVALENQAEYWATPRNSDYKGSGPEGSASHQHMLDRSYLCAQVQSFRPSGTWPTPAARDYRDPNLQSYQERSGKTKGEQLPNFLAHHFSLPVPPILDGLSFYERVRCLLRLCRLLRSSLRSPYNRARSMFRRRLNPSFVDWLQGLPPGFTSAAFDSSRMETWLSRCRRRLRLLNSPGDSAP